MPLFWLLLSLWILPVAASQPLSVFVSVLPQQGLVEEIAGGHAVVSVLVGPGQAPETYGLTPRQLVALQDAELFFRIGMPFEEVWLPKIRAAYPRLRIIDLRDGLDLIGAGEGADHDIDPHVWTDPVRVRQMLPSIRDALSELAPDHRTFFQKNMDRLDVRLKRLDEELTRQFLHLEERRFLVFHPAWGYFADRYGLQQLAIERGGKEASSTYLTRVIADLKEAGLGVLYVQPQSHPKQAEMIAAAINARLIVVDPLAKDILRGLRQLAGHLTSQRDG